MWKDQKKKQASIKLSQAISKGLMVRVNKCEDCFKEGRTIGYHKDYNKPLEVNWLCNSCFRKKLSTLFHKIKVLHSSL
jgi:hypothetical protein